MDLFNKRELERLRCENEKLHSEILKLTQEKLDLEWKLINDFYGAENVKRLSMALDLSALQEAKLNFEFSKDLARFAGVDEDKILSNLDEIDNFFCPEES